MSISITTCYLFIPLTEDQVEGLKSSIERYASDHDMRGLVLVGREGFNFTVSGTKDAIAGFKAFLSQSIGSDKLYFKDSLASQHPFRQFDVKVKPEIVTLGRTDLVPPADGINHVKPDQWHEMLHNPDNIVLDTRNNYEVEIGKFDRAIDFNLEEFGQFPEALKKSGIEKDKNVMIYCTGGIRCEKAILEMQEQGYKNVYQLSGGILEYLKEFPEQNFKGECFVFDHRVAVDQHLQPSQQYRLCPHCGQPAQEKIECVQCGDPQVICHHCQDKGIATCSKNCAHHHRMGHRSRKKQQKQGKMQPQ